MSGRTPGSPTDRSSRPCAAQRVGGSPVPLHIHPPPCASADTGGPARLLARWVEPCPDTIQGVTRSARGNHRACHAIELLCCGGNGHSMGLRPRNTLRYPATPGSTLHPSNYLNITRLEVSSGCQDHVGCGRVLSWLSCTQDRRFLRPGRRVGRRWYHPRRTQNKRGPLERAPSRVCIDPTWDGRQPFGGVPPLRSPLSLGGRRGEPRG